MLNPENWSWLLRRWRGGLSCGGWTREIYVGEKCMFSGSAPNQTYYLLVCPPLHSLNQLFTVCNLLTCSPSRDLGEHALSLYLWGEVYRAETVANLAPLQRFNTVYSWKRRFFSLFKGNKKCQKQNWIVFLCFTSYPLGPQCTEWKVFKT